MFFKRIVVITGLLLTLASGAQAQRRVRLDCPPAVRQGGNSTGISLSVEIGAGISRPFLYRNGGTGLGDHFRFAAFATPYVTANIYTPLRGSLELFSGIGITQQWQGLRFRHDGAGQGSYEATSYAGSWLFTVPVGVRFRAGNALRLSAAAYASFSTHKASTETGEPGFPPYLFTTPDDKARFNGGIRLGADVQILPRLAITATVAADAGSATPSGASADLTTRDGRRYSASLQPYLFHTGIGLTYRLSGG